MKRRASRPTAAPVAETSPEERVKHAVAIALRALARQPRSQVELAAALRRRGYAAPDIATALAQLSSRGLLDDAAVVGVVGRQAQARRLGSRRVQQILARRGVRGAAARDAFAESRAADLERARALLERRFPNGVGRAAADRARAARVLATRGFPGSIVRQALGIDVDLDAEDDA